MRVCFGVCMPVCRTANTVAGSCGNVVDPGFSTIKADEVSNHLCVCVCVVCLRVGHLNVEQTY